MDNVFSFWEVPAVAVKKKQNLVVLLLDFEKAYDRVQWIFLEGTIHHLGFNTTWIKGVPCLKVAWCTLITPKQHGGLGIIDPLDQCMALLAKLIVCVLLPGHAP